MPRTLRFYYKIYADVTVPSDIAEKLEANPELWYIHYGDLYYTNEKGEEVCIKGEEPDQEAVDWKRGAYAPEWVDDEESSDEDCTRRICCGCEEEVSCWNYDSDNNVYCVNCYDSDEDEKDEDDDEEDDEESSA